MSGTAAVSLAAAISFDRVSFRYPTGVLALDALSLTISAGTRTCVLGPNGAGKTTAIRLLLGTLMPTEGVVRVRGARPGTAAFDALRKTVGFLPQNPGMFPDVTVRDFLRLAADTRGVGSSTAVERWFGLQPHLATLLGHLSGGFQRRVTLAVALLGDPRILILDEPTTGLDPVATSELHELLASTMADRTSLLCTHDLREAETLCDRVVILRRGQTLAAESLSELRRERPRRIRVAARQGAAAIRAAIPEIACEFVPGSPEAVVLPGPTDEPATSAILRRLVGAGIDVHEFRVIDPTLEEIFLEQVRAP